MRIEIIRFYAPKLHLHDFADILYLLEHVFDRNIRFLEEYLDKIFSR